jgi:hypothetical protein
VVIGLTVIRGRGGGGPSDGAMGGGEVGGETHCRI